MTVLLEARADIGITCSYGNTALHLAARHGHLGSVRYLLNNKAKVDAQNSVGWSPLIGTACAGHREIVQALILAAAQTTLTDYDHGRNACMYAARGGHGPVVEALIATGINLTLEDNCGLTVSDHAGDHDRLRDSIELFERMNQELLEAAREADVKGATLALDEGACVNGLDEEGLSPLYYAMAAGSEEMVWLLMSRGATPFSSGSPTLKRELAKLGTRAKDLASAIEVGMKASESLLKASRDNDWPGVEQALNAGAHIGGKDKELRCPLMWAAWHGSDEAVRMLLGRKASIGQLDGQGWAALHFAAFRAQHKAAAALLELKADPRLKTFSGECLPHIAAQGNDRGPVLRLLARALGREAFRERDGLGMSPLQVAAINGCGNAMNALLTLGFDAREIDDRGRMPLALASVRGHAQAVSVFIEFCDGFPKMDEYKEAELDVPLGFDLLRMNDDDGCAPLALAALNGHYGVVCALIEHNAPVDSVDGRGNTPLLLGAAKGDFDICRRLLDAKADVDARNFMKIGAITLAPDIRLKEMLIAESEGRSVAARLAKNSSGDAPKKDEGDCVGPAPGSFRVRLEQLPVTYTGVALEKRIRTLFDLAARATRAAAKKQNSGFKPITDVTAVHVILDPISQRPKGHAYVDLKSNVADKMSGIGGLKHKSEKALQDADVAEAILACVPMSQVTKELGKDVRFIQEPTLL
eukprot:TRINITY_DN21459_c0_g1_i2.p1 TRINITY_DN21459_c0_g1~~TRINITY_DN21459_c0_g1_i2.p1  ORF type:complete len:700 (-),score=189.55 TRINITY_DN21459_c0_g1_i2:116-2215(-)